MEGQGCVHYGSTFVRIHLTVFSPFPIRDRQGQFYFPGQIPELFCGAVPWGPILPYDATTIRSNPKRANTTNK